MVQTELAVKNRELWPAWAPELLWNRSLQNGRAMSAL
jgi:hypothetical protein